MSHNHLSTLQYEYCINGSYLKNLNYNPQIGNSSIQVPTENTSFVPPLGTVSHLDALRNNISLEKKILAGMEPPSWARSEGYDRNGLGLHQEIIDFCQYFWPTPEELQLRLDLTAKVCEIIEQVAVGSRCLMFGSTRTLLFLPFSDIDIVVIYPEASDLSWEKKNDILAHIKEEFVNSDLCTKHDCHVIRATVPICKLTDRSTGLRVDISLQQENGLKVAKLLMSYVEQYPVFPYLTLVLKMLLYTRDLNEVFSGGLSSYALQLMILSFLQKPSNIPPECSSLNVGVLLMGFLQYYSQTFNHNNCTIVVLPPSNLPSFAPRIPNHQYVLLRKDFEAKIIKKHPDHNKRSRHANITTPSIQDPLDHCNDVGKGSHAYDIIRQMFESVHYHLWRQLHPDHIQRTQSQGRKAPSFLADILAVPPELMALRHYQRALAARLVLDPEVANDGYSKMMLSMPPINGLTSTVRPSSEQPAQPPPTLNGLAGAGDGEEAYARSQTSVQTTGSSTSVSPSDECASDRGQSPVAFSDAEIAQLHAGIHQSVDPTAPPLHHFPIPPNIAFQQFGYNTNNNANMIGPIAMQRFPMPAGVNPDGLRMMLLPTAFLARPPLPVSTAHGGQQQHQPQPTQQQHPAYLFAAPQPAHTGAPPQRQDSIPISTSSPSSSTDGPVEQMRGVSTSASSQQNHNNSSHPGKNQHHPHNGAQGNRRHNGGQHQFGGQHKQNHRVRQIQTMQPSSKWQ